MHHRIIGQGTAEERHEERLELLFATGGKLRVASRRRRALAGVQRDGLVDRSRLGRHADKGRSHEGPRGAAFATPGPMRRPSAGAGVVRAAGPSAFDGPLTNTA